MILVIICTYVVLANALRSSYQKLVRIDTLSLVKCMSTFW